MSQPKLLTWNAKQLSIYHKLLAGQTTAEIAISESVSKATVTKVSNAMKLKQSPANAYVPPNKGQTYPVANSTAGAKSTAGKPLATETPTTTDEKAPDAGTVDATQAASKAVLGNATMLNLKQLAMSCALTPIMLNARYASVVKLGWRDDMPWENFFDTCLVWLFRYWGISLQGYYEIDKDGNAPPPGTPSTKPSVNDIDDAKAAKLAKAIMSIMNENTPANAG